ncbi:MAG: hypothetical protein ACXW5U_07315 [Thermoanaerobaculia bacterium]
MSAPSKDTTRTGFVNKNQQRVICQTNQRGTDHLQYVYALSCGNCGHEYGANGTDVHLRKCPKCQGGKPGFPL